MKLDYPNVSCEKHPGTPKPGYIVCVHVLNGGKAVLYDEPTPTELGQILCGREDCHTNDLALFCCICAQQLIPGPFTPLDENGNRLHFDRRVVTFLPDYQDRRGLGFKGHIEINGQTFTVTGMDCGLDCACDAMITPTLGPVAI